MRGDEPLNRAVGDPCQRLQTQAVPGYTLSVSAIAPNSVKSFSQNNFTGFTRPMHLFARGVEERRGGLGPVGITPFPLPAHQTGRADFPHPASRPASPQSTRRGAKMDPTSSDHTELPEHDPIEETPGAARRHLMAPDQEMTNSLVDRVVDGPVSRHSRPMAEVLRPTAQHAVQLIAHLGPGGVVAGTEHPADLRLEPGNAPLGRARPQVPVAILAKPMRAEAVAQEVEALLAGLTHAGLRLVQGQAVPSPAASRPEPLSHVRERG